MLNSDQYLYLRQYLLQRGLQLDSVRVSGCVNPSIANAPYGTLTITIDYQLAFAI